MEELILGLAEKTVLGAGFFYLLHYLVKNMDGITVNLTSFGEVLHKVSDTLLKIDMRVEQLEQKIKDLERRGET